MNGVGVQGVYEWLSGRPTPGKQAELMYNRDASELRHKKDLVLHLGCNNWAGQKKEVRCMLVLFSVFLCRSASFQNVAFCHAHVC